MGNETVKTLLEKRSALENERPAIDAEFERITNLKNDLDERLKALDLVLKMFSDGAVSEDVEQIENPITQTKSQNLPFELAPPKVDVTPETVIPIKQIVRDNFNRLPQVFTKHNVASLIRSFRPEITEVNDNTLSAIMRQLVSLQMSRISVRGTGKSPQVYEKVVI